MWYDSGGERGSVSVIGSAVPEYTGQGGIKMENRVPSDRLIQQIIAAPAQQFLSRNDTHALQLLEYRFGFFRFLLIKRNHGYSSIHYSAGQDTSRSCAFRYFSTRRKSALSYLP